MKPEPIIRKAPIDEVRLLRNSLLRPGYPPETCIYPGDDSNDTFHAGAFIGDMLVGIASVISEQFPVLMNTFAWRLRGMAVQENARHLGYGTALLDTCIEYIKIMGGELIWCHARTASLYFYEKNGFQIIGDPFNIPESGSHYVMWRSLGNS